MDPVEEFLREKHAAGARDIPKMFGDSLLTGATAAAAGATLSGAGYGAMHLYNAATKGRDFRRMLQTNPDLVAEHERDPKGFNQLFSSLRSVNTQFSKDPIIAGTYMRRMVGSPAAGGVLTDALGFRDKGDTSFGGHTLDTGLKGVLQGAKASQPRDASANRRQRPDEE